MSIDNDDSGGEVLVRPPAHPVPTLQGPFEESMIESVNDAADTDVPSDALARRAILLDAPTYLRVISGRWKQKPGEKYHPLWKLVAQMSFGLHLLARNLAKSEEEVMKILQAHVDDIDGFLERTTEDFDLAHTDVRERLRCLKLPLSHSDVFDRMLEDRAFRASILEGNEKIEHIIHRTKKAMRDSLKDVQKGFDATNVLDKYLTTLAVGWHRQTPEHEAVFIAMIGNVEGWRKAFMELHLQGNKLGGVLNKLTEVVGEMQRRAAVVSRRLLAKSQTSSHPLSQSTTMLGSNRSESRASQTQKPLPLAPDQRSGRKTSSRATHIVDSSSRLDFDQRSSPRCSSASPSLSHGSPESRTSNRALLNSDTAALFSSRTSSPETHFTTPLTFSRKELQLPVEAEPPAELPADVPEDVLRQAPVSVKNRLSATLGIKPKDSSEHRISSVFYPKALGDLLNGSQTPTMLLTPQTAGNRGTALRSSSVHTDSDTDYFSAHEQSPSIGLISPEPIEHFGSTASSPGPEVPRSSAVSPISDKASRPPRPRIAFTSHPSVMKMASPPVEPPISRESMVIAEVHQRQESESSLGEPGPEIVDLDSEPAVWQESEHSLVSANENFPPDTDVSTHAAPDPPMPAQVDMAQSKSESSKEMQAEGDSAVAIQPAVSTPSEEARYGPSPAADIVVNSELQHSSQNPVTGQGPEVVEQGPIHTGASGPNHPDTDDGPEGEETRAVGEMIDVASGRQNARERAFAVELQAFVPSGRSPIIPRSPIELEAPQQHFILPPRASAVPKSGRKESTLTSLRQRAEYFRFAANQTARQGLKPKDFSQSPGQEPEPIRPLQLKLARRDGKIVAVPLHTPPDADKKASPRSLESPRSPYGDADVITDMIQQMSSTPAGSPAHTRTPSAASSNSAQIQLERLSHTFAPPDSAPSPPGPGGRPMVNPDYTNAGLFEGERGQHPRRGSRSSKGGGWKELLGGTGNPSRHSSDGVSSSKPATRASGGIRPQSARAIMADMLTTAGKDLFSFKGDGKHPVQVSSG